MIDDAVSMAEAQISALEKDLAAEKAAHEITKTKVLALEDKIHVVERQIVQYRERFRAALQTLEV